MIAISDIDENGINENLQTRYRKEQIYVSFCSTCTWICNEYFKVFLQLFCFVWKEDLMDYIDYLFDCELYTKMTNRWNHFPNKKKFSYEKCIYPFTEFVSISTWNSCFCAAAHQWKMHVVMHTACALIVQGTIRPYNRWFMYQILPALLATYTIFKSAQCCNLKVLQSQLGLSDFLIYIFLIQQRLLSMHSKLDKLNYLFLFIFLILEVL